MLSRPPLILPLFSPVPPNTAADFQVPDICLFLVIYDSLYRSFPIPPFFPSPESGGIGGFDSIFLHPPVLYSC